MRHATLVVFLVVPGTLNFWQGWAFIAVNLVATVIFWTYFYKHDRELLVRRLLHKEHIAGQKIIMFVMRIVSISIYVVCGLDNRFGWSWLYLRPVPWWLTVLALVCYAYSYWLSVPVFHANRFAGSVIQVEAGQTVVETGPYRLVRHPMYSVSLFLSFWIPFALGSFMALPLVVLLAFMIVLRLIDEEKILQHELSGYAEYCGRTPWRLIPFLW